MRKFRHASLVTKPTIIDAIGEYVTRSGESVVVTGIDKRVSYAATGHYPDPHIKESWDISGRLYPNMESANDIVMKKGE